MSQRMAASPRSSRTAAIEERSGSRRRGSTVATAHAARPDGRLRSLVGLNGLTTIVAIRTVDDYAHAEQLAAAFITVRRHCEVQLVLLRTGQHRTTLMRRISAQGVRSTVHAISDSYDYQWSDLFAAADVVVLGSSSEPLCCWTCWPRDGR